MIKSILTEEVINGLEKMKSNGDIIDYNFDGNLWITFPSGNKMTIQEALRCLSLPIKHV